MLKLGVMGSLFVFGICAASSDGPWFPWANIGGIVLLGIFAYAVNKVELED